MTNVISDWLSREGRLHFTLIDPDKQTAEAAGELAALAESSGSDAVMVGGSTAFGDATAETVAAIKKVCALPVILFPSTCDGVCPRADYLFFMMLLNSRSSRFLVGEQVKAAPSLKECGIKPISMGYVVVSTSAKPTTVERVGDVDVIHEEDAAKAVAYALTAQYYGMSCVYLEAGSGADKPVPDEMVSAVKEALDIPLIVGGGIRDAASATAKIVAGADVVVTGTIAEDDPGRLSGIIAAVKKG